MSARDSGGHNPSRRIRPTEEQTRSQARTPFAPLKTDAHADDFERAAAGVRPSIEALNAAACVHLRVLARFRRVLPISVGWRAGDLESLGSEVANR